MRERAIKFLSTKLKTLSEEVMTKEVEEYVFAETKKVSVFTDLSLIVNDWPQSILQISIEISARNSY